MDPLRGRNNLEITHVLLEVIMVNRIEKIGRFTSSILITIIALLITQIITYVIYRLTNGNMSLSGRIASFASPILISPFLSWWFLGLLLRISKLEKEMRFLATYDTLTGVYNRNSFLSICNSILNLLKREKSPLTLLYIDLDHFKNVNDTFGHDVGDYVLKKIGEYLKTSIRKSDIVGRVGGEEFVVVLPKTDIQNGIAIAEKIRKGIACLEMIYNDKIIKITASIGISSNTYLEYIGIEKLLKMADLALYHVKNNGRNKLYVNQDCIKEKDNTKIMELIGFECEN